MAEIKLTDSEKLDPVIQTKPKIKKKGLLSRLSDAFFYDSFEDMGRDMISNIIVPAIKDTILNLVESALGRNGRSGRSYRSSEPRAYYSLYDDDRRSSRSRANTNSRRSNSVEIIEFKSRSDVLYVLDAMGDIVDRRGKVSLKQYYELSGFESEYTDDWYGWTSLHNVDIYTGHDKDGQIVYMLDLPRPVCIK